MGEQALPSAMDFALPSPPLSSGPKTSATGYMGLTKIRDHGSDSNRLVLVFAGDGYLESDITSGVFAAAVEAYLVSMENDPPWDMLLAVANVYRMDFASNERGADYEDAAPPGGTLKDTYLGARYWTTGIERLLSLDYTGQSRVLGAANTYIGIGKWDEMCVIVNSTKFGASGGLISVASVHANGKNSMKHELGHSFAGLGDEYYTTSATYTGVRPAKRNLDNEPSAPKWAVWVEAGTPLPTPDSSTYQSVVGTFEGASDYRYGIYRPWRECRMRSSSQPFCPVCKEAHVMEFFDVVSLMDNATPSTSNVVTMTGQTNLTLTLLPSKASP